MDTQVKISVVIGSYNNAEPLAKVLAGFSKQKRSVPFEVIVVDSESSDGSLSQFDGQKFPFEFKPITQKNQGTATARNRGVAEAKSEYIIITDADMIPAPGFVQAHYDAHQAAKRPCCFEGLAWNLPSLDWPPNPKTLRPQVGTHPKNGAKLGWWYFLTGNISMPKSVFENAQGFSRDFKGYGWEDLELGYRLVKKEGIPFYYLRTAVNYHYHVLNADADIQRCVRKGESAKIVLKKHPELKTFLGINPLSKFIYKSIHPKTKLHQAIQGWLESDTAWKRRFSTWFLKEYYYLSGLLGK